MGIVNDLQNNRGIVSGLHYSLPPRQPSQPSGNPHGFNPTLNQAEYGTAQWSPYGMQLMSTPPHGAVDYFPTFPFRGVRNYVGAQRFGHPVSEMLYARLRGYRGILPVNQLPFINKPYPYTIPVYSQFGEA